MKLPASPGRPASILVVDDDRRVVELLSIALTAYGFRVLSAADGDEALRVALGERPDLVVLDVRLPKKSGLEVCELLRQDPDDPHVPIILVSAAAETEARLQGLARGADDYVAKPFSPKELIARIRRLLARSSETREVLRRGVEAERELARAREEAKRSQSELKAQQRLRDLMLYIGREVSPVLDLDEMTRRLMILVRSRLEVGTAALLGPGGADGRLRPLCAHADGRVGIAKLAIDGCGELARLLCGLGRPVRRHELERFPELRHELPQLVAAGLTLLAPLCGPEGLEGLILVDERLDGQDFSRADIETLKALCEASAVPLHNAQRCHAQARGLLDALAALAPVDPCLDSARAAATDLLERAAMALPDRQRELVLKAAALGEWAASPSGRRALACLAGCDLSGRLSELARIVERAAETTSLARGMELDDVTPADELRAAALLAAALAFGRGRAGGLDPGDAMALAEQELGAALDEGTRRILRESSEGRAQVPDRAAES